MSHPSLPRLDNPGGQVEFLGNESRGRPNKAFGARILARVNESPGDVLVERRWEVVATCFHASTVTHRTRTWNHPPAQQEAPLAGIIPARGASSASYSAFTRRRGAAGPDGTSAPRQPWGGHRPPLRPLIPMRHRRPFR